MTNFPQSRHCTAKGTWPIEFSKEWSEGCKQKDEVDDEEETEELFRDRDFCGKEMTAEDANYFIWAYVIALGIGAFGVSITQSMGKERFSHRIVSCSIF